MICKTVFFIKRFLVILFFILFQSTGFTQINFRCDIIWEDIKKYKSGEESHITASRHQCLTDSLKNKLISILKNEFTEKELDTYIEYNREKDWLERIENHTWYLIEKDSSRYEKVRDSLIYEKNTFLREKALRRPVDRSVIYLIGKLDIKEAIPDLHKALERPDMYNAFSVQLTLARLEDSIYYPLLLEQCSQPIILDYETPYNVRI